MTYSAQLATGCKNSSWCRYKSLAELHHHLSTSILRGASETTLKVSFYPNLGFFMHQQTVNLSLDMFALHRCPRLLLLLWWINNILMPWCGIGHTHRLGLDYFYLQHVQLLCSLILTCVFSPGGCLFSTVCFHLGSIYFLLISTCVQRVCIDQSVKRHSHNHLRPYKGNYQLPRITQVNHK